jgi:hypothetical protein
MGEPAAPPYFVRDYCAACGELLRAAPLGGKYACHAGAAMYWSEAPPLPADERTFERMTGLRQRMQTEWLNFKPGTEGYGQRIEHRPLFLYRSVSGRLT